MPWKTVSIFIICTITLLPSVHADPREFLHAEHLSIVYPPTLSGAAVEVAEIYPHIRTEVESALHMEADFRPTVVLVPSSAFFQRMMRHDRFVAVAIPEKKLIVVDYSRMHTDPFTLRTTLKHELCHLLLNHHIHRDRLPKWLDEGVAQWVSGGISEIILDRGVSTLEKAVMTGRYLSLSRLTTAFPRDHDALQLAYEESKSIIAYIVDQYGYEGLNCLIENLRNGTAISVAVRKCFSISLGELEKRWHRHLEKKDYLLAYLSIHVYEILFFAAALLTVYGFFRILLKRKRYTDADDEDEP